MERKKISKSVFGHKIDNRCPGYTFWEKFFVWAGLLADHETNEWCCYVDDQLSILEHKCHGLAFELV